jgi:pimeloyl-ACP methyl ester carboxylesterase
MDPGDDGTVGVHAGIVRELFLQDCDDATADGAVARLTRQSATPFAQPPRAIAWHDKPSTYVVCTEDLAIPAPLQRRRAAPSARLVDFHAGHHPFLSRPEAFAACLAAELQRVT